MTVKSPDVAVVKFVDPQGNVITDEKMVKLSSELEILTRAFTQKVHETAERFGVKLAVHVQFEGVNPQQTITEDN